MKRTTSIIIAATATTSLARADIIVPTPSLASTIGIPIVILGALGVGAFFLIRWIVKKVRA